MKHKITKLIEQLAPNELTRLHQHIKAQYNINDIPIKQKDKTIVFTDDYLNMKKQLKESK